MGTPVILMSTKPVLGRGDISEAYNHVLPAYCRETVHRVNLGKRHEVPEARGPRPARSQTPPQRPWEDRGVTSSAMPGARPVQPPAARPTAVQPQAAALVPSLRMPELLRPVQRGQKTALGLMQGDRSVLRVAMGWNVSDARCDLDVSAFLLGADDRVPSDDWFVFYGQPQSPDGSVRFAMDGRVDREYITVDLARLSGSIQRVVFVMTINEALENGLSFGMIREAWLRILDGSGRELLSYCPSEFRRTITSMTVGELYLHRGEWRFNPVGNGVSVDLAGQCAIYGVSITD